MLRVAARCFFLFILSYFFVSFANAVENREAFYAISSLRFHVNELISLADDEDAIVFERKDLEYLWYSASNCPYFIEILSAQFYYYESRGTNIPLLIQTEEILEKVWEKLNPEFTGIKEVVTDTAFSLVTNRISYLLPKDHYLKHNLDEIFSKPDVLENSENFQEAGFVTLSHQGTGMRVASHPLLHGFLIKTYISSEKKQDDNWNWMVQRCEGASNIRKLIRQEQLRYFTVPDKWIYVLPKSTKKNSYTQTAVLVVTHMKIVSDEESRKAWNQATPNHLRELYCILSHGYASSFLPRNIPYTKKKKFSCIDTAYAKRTPNFKKPKSYFSKEMKVYWDKLVKSGGNVY